MAETPDISEPIDIPPRMSDRQLFAVAWIAYDAYPRLARHPPAQSLESAAAAEEDVSTDENGEYPESFRTSHARTVRRLEDRGFIQQYRREWGGWQEGWVDVPAKRREKAKTVALTSEGWRLAAEIRRQARDGRYSRSFDTLF